MKGNCLLYISAVLPALSETFVYRELLALRLIGIAVRTVSVHLSKDRFDDPHLSDLARSTMSVYGPGMLKLFQDAAREVATRPIRSAGTLLLSARDAVTAGDIHAVGGRLKVLWHAVAALALARRVGRRCNSERVVHIHAHMAHVPTTIAMYAARQLDITFSFTGHANDLFPTRCLLGEKVRRSLFVSCISRWHREFYRSIHPKQCVSLPIVRCGVDTTRVRPVAACRGPHLRVLSVGRLVEKKGFDTLIRAAGMIARRGKARLSVVIAGDGPEAGKLRRLAAELAPGAGVELLGEVSNRAVMRLMAESNVFALPMRVASGGDRDGIPVVLMEAMAHGRCVVCGDLVTVRELVTHGETGILVPTDDARALSEALERLATDGALMEAIGARARMKIETEFDTGTNARALLHTMRLHGVAV